MFLVSYTWSLRTENARGESPLLKVAKVVCRPLPHLISHSDVGVTGRSESPLREGTSEGNETGENLLEQVFDLF